MAQTTKWLPAVLDYNIMKKVKSSISTVWPVSSVKTAKFFEAHKILMIFITKLITGCDHAHGSGLFLL